MFGQPLRLLTSVDSTNNVAVQWARAGAPHGAAVRAAAQSSGRGRRGREWRSPAGLGLYLSLILRPDVELARVPQLTMVAALAAARAIEKQSDLATNVKWPNDIILRERKIGGILSEACGSAARSGINSINSVHSQPAHAPNMVEFIVIGIGINVNFGAEDLQDLPRGPQLAASSLLIESGQEWPVDDVAKGWLGEMETLYHDYQMNGWEALRAEWLQRDILMGRRVAIETQRERYCGTVKGVDADGTLRVQTADALRRVAAGEASLEA